MSLRRSDPRVCKKCIQALMMETYRNRPRDKVHLRCHRSVCGHTFKGLSLQKWERIRAESGRDLGKTGPEDIRYCDKCHEGLWTPSTKEPSSGHEVHLECTVHDCDGSTAMTPEEWRVVLNYEAEPHPQSRQGLLNGAVLRPVADELNGFLQDAGLKADQSYAIVMMVVDGGFSGSCFLMPLGGDDTVMSVPGSLFALDHMVQYGAFEVEQGRVVPQSDLPSLDWPTFREMLATHGHTHRIMGSSFAEDVVHKIHDRRRYGR